jgi:putative oxidoreductase
MRMHPYQPALTDAGLLLLRLVVGVVFLYHGVAKLADPAAFAGFLERLGVFLPTVAAWGVALVESIGGLALMVGLLTRIAGLLLAINMTVAIILVHSHAFNVQEGGMEFALTLGIASLALVLTGPGRFSIAGLIRGTCCRSTA